MSLQGSPDSNIAALAATAACVLAYKYLEARREKQEAYFSEKQELYVDEGQHAGDNAVAGDAQFLRLAEKLKTIEVDGLKNLCVVVDFDRTLSAFSGRRPGTTGQTAHGICEVHLSEGLQAKAKAINAYFYPIEVDPTVPLDKKIPLMEAWYSSINDLLIEAGFRRSHIRTSVRDANVKLRPGVVELLDFCKAHEVPLIIFSAGVGDILKEVIKQQYGPLPKLSTIVSNWMRFAPVTAEDALHANSPAGTLPSPAPFQVGGAGAMVASPKPASPAIVDPGEQTDFQSPTDDSSSASSASSSSSCSQQQSPEGSLSVRKAKAKPFKAPEQRLVGWSSPLIHMFNKTMKNAVEHNPRVAELWRPNALLLGDGVGDAIMACTAEEDASGKGGNGGPATGVIVPPSPRSGTNNTVLRVGIVNTNVEALLPKYVPAFDALLLRDPSIAAVNNLLKRMAAKSASGAPSLLHPLSLLSSPSSTSEQQPGKQKQQEQRLLSAEAARAIIERLLLPEFL